MGILDFFRGSKDERIAKRLVEELRKMGDPRRMEFSGEEGLILTFDEKGEQNGRVSLHHLRHELDRAAKGEHDSIYARYASGSAILAKPRDAKSFADVRLSLGVLLKDETYPDYIELMNRVELGTTKVDALLWRPVAPRVIACCVSAEEGGLLFLKQSDLSTWSIDADEVFDQAIVNIRALEMESSDSQGCHFFNAQDSFITARLLCTEKFGAFALDGLPVVVVPDRDTLFFTGSRNEEGLAGLARVVTRQLAEASRHISVRPLLLTTEGWKEFDPPESCRVAFGNAARSFDQNNWASFRALYERDLQTRGENIFVAELAVNDLNDTGEYFTSIVWSAGVDSIVPEADGVYFYDAQGKPVRFAIWADVMRVMGAALERMEGLPVRYQVRAFPTAEQFVAMGARQSSL